MRAAKTRREMCWWSQAPGHWRFCTNELLELLELDKLTNIPQGERGWCRARRTRWTDRGEKKERTNRDRCVKERRTWVVKVNVTQERESKGRTKATLRVHPRSLIRSVVAPHSTLKSFQSSMLRTEERCLRRDKRGNTRAFLRKSSNEQTRPFIENCEHYY